MVCNLFAYFYGFFSLFYRVTMGSQRAFGEDDFSAGPGEIYYFFEKNIIGVQT